MDAQAWLEELTCSRAIAVIRAPSLDIGYRMAQAVAAGGMRMIEVTWTSDRPGDLIQRLREDLPTCCVGAGTVLNPTDLRQAIAAGAQFLFSPHTDLDLLRWAIAHQVPMVPGALSPNEIVAAWQSGAATVKVFPVQAVGGAAYIRSLQGPLGHIPLIPTGGVTLQHAADLITAGAIAVGVSGQLFPAEAIATQNWSAVTHQARQLGQALRPFIHHPRVDVEDNRLAQGHDWVESQSPSQHSRTGDTWV